MKFSEMFNVQSYENTEHGINFNQNELTAIKNKVWVYVEKIGEDEVNKLNYSETGKWADLDGSYSNFDCD